MPVRLVAGTVMLAALAAADNSQQCREAMVVAVHAAVRAYERCVTASLGRNDCSADYMELQITQRDFERAVDERRANCERE